MVCYSNRELICLAFLVIIFLDINSVSQELSNNKTSLDFSPPGLAWCRRAGKGGGGGNLGLFVWEVFPLSLIYFSDSSDLLSSSWLKSELHSVVHTVKFDSYIGHLSVCFQICSQTLLCSMCVTGAYPHKLFPRLPCPLESSQVQPVRGTGERLQVGRRKEAKVFLPGFSASDGHFWQWLGLFYGSVSCGKPFPSWSQPPLTVPPWIQLFRGLWLPDSSNLPFDPSV